VAKKNIEGCKPSRLPILSCCHTQLSHDCDTRIDNVAVRLMRDEPAFASSRFFGDLVSQNTVTGPALIIGDQLEISLLSQSSLSQLDYRMATLAQSGDLVVVSHRNLAFETYLKHFLSVDGVQFVETARSYLPSVEPASIACRKQVHLKSAINNIAIDAAGMTILSYLTTGNIWRLGQTISGETGRPARICGPAPRISKRVNDKIWFTNVVDAMFGTQSTLPSFAAFGPAAAAALVARLSKTSERVVVKVPDSAGSAGNFAFSSSELSQLSLASIRLKLLQLMRAEGWENRYPLQIGVWDCNVLSSPSAQIWIPKSEEGPPIIEGIFEQIVERVMGKFVGARRARLPDVLDDRFKREATALAVLFQRLGYFGRCSMDAIVSKDGKESLRLHWIECNGRWGGVSIPMTLANKLCDHNRPNGLVIIQQSNPDHQFISTKRAVDLLDDMLFKYGASKSGIVLLSPTERSNGSRLNFMAIAGNQTEAERLAGRVIERLTRSSPN